MVVVEFILYAGCLLIGDIIIFVDVILTHFLLKDFALLSMSILFYFNLSVLPGQTICSNIKLSRFYLTKISTLKTYIHSVNHSTL